MGNDAARVGSGLPDRKVIAAHISQRLHRDADSLRAQWDNAKPVRVFILDGLVPEGWLEPLARHLPDPAKMLLRSNLRERKRVKVDFSNDFPLFGEFLSAFHEKSVVDAVSKITGLKALEADPSLYASGVSVMTEGDFLNPHLDNSHDGEQLLYRSLNLLFYVSPDWKKEMGGSLEVWDWKNRAKTEVPALFNRLVVMETNDRSWHSVNQVKTSRSRVCVSNYYFSAICPTTSDYKQVTTFRGRPEEPIRNLVLVLDGYLREILGRAFPFLLKNTRHRLTKKAK